MNHLIIKNGNVYTDGSFKKADIIIKDGIIKEITSDTGNLEDFEVFDVNEQNIVPGFIDVHTHGAVNVDVNGATAEDLDKISYFFALQGTTSWLCSILTDTKEQTLWCIDQYNKHKNQECNGAKLMGIHLEGPFLAPEYKGAMPEHLLIEPDMELIKEYQTAANGDVKYITVSPEVEGIPDCIDDLKELGIVVAIGHSGADYDIAMKSINNGATSATHTFNAMKLMHQHFPAIAGAVLESDIYCEAICDGRHLHPGIVRLLIKTKGIDKVVAVTDSIMATGLPDGNYKLGVNDVVVVDGDAKLANGGARAGSTLTTINALKNLMEFTKRPLEEVIVLLTKNPATMLGLYDKIGSISVGKYADLVVLNKDNDVIATFVQGKRIMK
ncbi:N-acetylglucosamine-6-phosphate deacetylase [Mobilisporobacter senegalensis]|uniref:N-acetylglucosamine-6-phosphate deacetylase n=1 Tax=Mobilisporobacter senegalensis TaxID=1329262 RepID=A0A3N1XF19_9FIRM|nr:N-acetylglucosamine-6-phosphate deacetylase [Mobilisporobacter senegalensis]ROR25309.1 N-acetylglucosamine-6-phosphate deacetylase [Mobilisporobacter senegalensis]